MAVSTLGTVVEQSLVDVAAATCAPGGEPVLLILDSLDSLETQRLCELLDAAKDWSEAGNSRVLITTRRPDLNHPAYPTTGSHQHRYRALEGFNILNIHDYHYNLSSHFAAREKQVMPA